MSGSLMIDVGLVVALVTIGFVAISSPDFRRPLALIALAAIMGAYALSFLATERIVGSRRRSRRRLASQASLNQRPGYRG
ncbi:MAG: hypothetical protein ACRDIY_14580 [Chloroflexota bacterium]